MLRQNGTRQLRGQPIVHPRGSTAQLLHRGRHDVSEPTTGRWSVQNRMPGTSDKRDVTDPPTLRNSTSSSHHHPPASSVDNVHQMAQRPLTPSKHETVIVFFFSATNYNSRKPNINKCNFRDERFRERNNLEGRTKEGKKPSNNMRQQQRTSRNASREPTN